ncbi:hypothetical protein GTQ99_00720 [Kineococcus sp. T13]|uniref:DUF6519 domain-containing protein n=1 Tax=Kineococcus vitellinus TaxID=2696565 RepID=UPI00141332CA|nr:DUF6519 domain-containing protein [Kineococcus vitellinus]NAZ73955.1 hypothetical protein [Kineococcus vitellinus]
MTMRNDATRLRVRTTDRRRPRAVVARQGQVLLDADVDQQSDHLLERVDTGTSDVLGSPGRLVVPAGSTAFVVTAAPSPADCGLGPGHGYLDGWLVENVIDDCTLATQPHPRTDTTPGPPVLLAIKCLTRLVDPVEEPALADPALGDAQAAGRALLDWQVFPFAPAAGWGGPLTCATSVTHPDWLKLVAPSTGTLAVVPDATPPSTDPCSLTPQGGYSRPDNLLFRCEVDGGTARSDYPAADGPRFALDGLRVKVSRRNASVLARITGVTGTELTVEPPALDPLNWFAPGLFAEIVSPHDDVDPRAASAGGRLFRVALADDTVVTLEAAAASAAAALDPDDGWYLRLWDTLADGSGTGVVSTAADPAVSQLLDLGDGLKIRLGGGPGAVFRRGDYWTFAARADGSVDWPAGNPFEPPHGPSVRYAPLLALDPAGDPAGEDCRIQTGTLTDRVLLYRGGDGQTVPLEGGGDVPLPSSLRVAVVRGRTPVAGATVEWSVPATPTGSPATVVDGTGISGATSRAVVTDANGLCEVQWSISAAAPEATHRIQARVPGTGGADESPPVVFTAGFRTAALTSYQSGACPLLMGSSTVQEALDTLCANIGEPAEAETLRLSTLRLRGDKTGITDLLREELLLNGLEVPHHAFNEGVGIGITDAVLECRPQPFDPIVEVVVDLPYPTTDYDKLYWARASRDRGQRDEGISGPFGFRSVRLDGNLEVRRDDAGDGFEPGLVWLPSEQARTFLDTVPFHLFGYAPLVDGELEEAGWKLDQRAERILCRLRVRSAHVWGTGPKSGERAYLDAEHLGASEGATGRELLVGERDPQRAADLDFFFYLVVDG